MDELVRGRSLIAKERATELAGRCCSVYGDLVLDEDVELLAHERGWVWAIYYTQGKGRTHFALIHADGTPLAPVIANEIIAADNRCGGSLHTLTCINPAPVHSADNAQQVNAALKAYERYLTEECGYIHLDGLPADSEVGSRRLQLETLFVPLHLDINEEVKRKQVGTVLSDYPRLAKLLQEAREAMPTELGFVQGSVEDFIHRVEDRSSLLMMSGLDIEDGRLVEFYEFRHLTFQEFLTARAMVEGWYPGRKEDDTLASVLEPHFEDEEWREVIPLAAALGGKATETLIQRLTEQVRVFNDDDAWVQGRRSLVSILGSCLADEVAARPETIRAAMQEIVRTGGGIWSK
ncbi:MAG: hypothetical protein ICV60_10965 [Pyrinomonadaceae bacterium]|nr:hypothetical protein [Pyrinomonadaceae bacterium]